MEIRILMFANMIMQIGRGITIITIKRRIGISPSSDPTISLHSDAAIVRIGQVRQPSILRPELTHYLASICFQILTKFGTLLLSFIPGRYFFSFSFVSRHKKRPQFPRAALFFFLLENISIPLIPSSLVAPDCQVGHLLCFLSLYCFNFF